MALNADQVKELKKQLATQIAHLPAAQREEAQQQIDEMSAETLEIMLQEQTERSDKSVLRKISEGTLAAKKVDENKWAIAVLDIRPLSRGHVLIIPRVIVSPKSQLPTQAFTLAKKVAKRIKSKLKPQGTEIQTETKFEEKVLNVIPYYEKPLSITSPRYEASAEELNQVQKMIAAKPRKARAKKEAIRPSQIITESTSYKLKRKIP